MQLEWHPNLCLLTVQPLNCVVGLFSYANLVRDLRKQVFSASSVLRQPKHFVGLLHKRQRTLLLDFNTGTFCCLRDVRLVRCLVLQAIFVLQQAPKAEWRSRLSQHATVTPLALG